MGWFSKCRRVPLVDILVHFDNQPICTHLGLLAVGVRGGPLHACMRGAHAGLRPRLADGLAGWARGTPGMERVHA